MDTVCVAPRAGAWIETNTKVVKFFKVLGRPSRRGVD